MRNAAWPERPATHPLPLPLTTALLSLLLFLVFSASRAEAYVGLCCGKCGGNMPMNIPGGGIPETCEFRFKLTPMYMHMDELKDGTSDVDPASILGMPAPGVYMAAPTSMDMRMLNLSAGYSLTDDFFAGLMFMYKENEMDMLFNSGMATMTGRPGYTMESSGMGDTMLMTKYRLFADDPLLPTSQASLLASLSLPTGSIREKNTTHPMPARQAELLPYAMQLGSGTFDPMLGFLYQGSASPWWWGADLSATWRVHDNAAGYRLGDRYALDLYMMRQLRYDFLLHGQVNASSEGRIRGEMDEALTGESGHATPGDPLSPYMTPAWDPAHYGGKRVSLSGGFQWQPWPMHIVDLTVQVPVYENLNGPQMSEDYRVMLTWYVEVPTKRSVRHPDNMQAAGESRLGF